VLKVVDMSVVRTLLTPLDYARIRHPLKRAVDFWSFAAPFAVAMVAVAIWPTLNIFGESGLIIGINSLLAILTGFFITSLAAIATFNGTVYHIDESLEGEAALLDGEPLTRRQFLSHLFAYVAFLSLILYFCGVLSLAAASTMHGTLDFIDRFLCRLAFLSIFSGVLGNIFGATMIGLVFLSSRFGRLAKKDKFKVVAKPEAQNVSKIEII